MNNRCESLMSAAFAQGKALIPFITCGDPDLKVTAEAIRMAAEGGADLIELGIPFSDPTAEGPVIQGANIRALKNGITTDKILDFVKALRADVTIPMIFVTYANVIFSYGAERFFAACKEAQICGVRIPDIPYEEKEEFLPVCKKYGVDLISYVAPAAADRIAMIAKEAEGLIYVVPGQSACGTGGEIVIDFKDMIDIIRKNSDVPCVISCNCRTAEQAKHLAALSDGVVLDTVVIEKLEQYGVEAPKQIKTLMKEAKQAVV